jgi:histidinol-phosphate phosphatase family protein
MNRNYRVLIGIDRDGTLIHDTGDFPGKNWPNEKFELMDYARVGLHLMKAQIPNVKIAMITNQSGPARGIVREEHLPEIHESIQNLLPFRLDGVYVCTHVKKEYAERHNITGEAYAKYVTNCKCRKPNTGMLEQASMNLFGLPLKDLDIVYMIGDRPEDVQTGLNAGSNGVGVYIPSTVKDHAERLEEVVSLQQANPKRVIIANSFHDASIKLVCDFEYNKSRRIA